MAELFLNGLLNNLVILKSAYDIESCMEELIQDASKVAAGSEGLLFLPYLLGERAPIWNANARGVYFGINIKHEQTAFYKSYN